jgi:hypothetical protein
MVRKIGTPVREKNANQRRMRPMATKVITINTIPVCTTFQVGVNVQDSEGHHSIVYDVVVQKGSIHIEHQDYQSGPLAEIDPACQKLNDMVNSFTDQVVASVEEQIGTSIREIFEVPSILELAAVQSDIDSFILSRQASV